MQSIPRGRPILSQEVRGTSARGQFQFRVLTPSRKRSVPLAAPRQVDTQDHAWDSLCCHMHREFMRNAVLNVTLIIPATAYHQRNYVERYSRFKASTGYCTFQVSIWNFARMFAEGPHRCTIFIVTRQWLLAISSIARCAEVWRSRCASEIAPEA